MHRKLNDRTRYGLPALIGLVTIGILLFLGDLHSRYSSAITDAERSNARLADVLAEQASSTFEALDRTLTAAELVRTNSSAGLYPMAMAYRALRLLRSSNPLVTGIEWTNAEGDVLVHSFDGDPARPSLAGRPYFEAQRNGKGERFLIDRPIRSVETGQWSTSVSRRLSNADGSFAGIISTTLDLSYFAPVFKALKPESNGSVVLMDRDGVVLTREPFVDIAMQTSFKSDSPILKYLSKMDSGTIAAVSQIDGISRLIAFKAVPGFPLVLIVTSARTLALGPVYEHVRAIAPVATALIVLVVLGGAHLLRQDRAIARQAALLQAALENMEQGLIVVDNKGTLPVCNRRAMELLDLPPSLMGSNPNADDLIAYQTRQGEFANLPEDVKRRLLPRIFSESRNVYERKRPNGTILEIQTVPFANGGVVRTYTDVTAQRAAEAALKDSETRYRLLADSSTDMIFRLDLDLIRRYVSPASYEILGYAAEELIDRKPLNMIHPDDAQDVEETYQAVLNGRERASVTNRIRHRDGHWVWVEAELRLVRDQDGRPGGILGALRDVSARKAAEDEAIAARKLAEQAAAAQGQFLATMSHELRTPLNSVLGFADIILDRNDLDPEVRRQVGLIQTAGAFLLTAVNDVLDFSKIEEGKLELVSTEFSLTSLIDGSISVLRDAASKKHLELTVETDRRIPQFVCGDESRLRQVLLNLLNNAIKFTPSGHVALTVEHIESRSDGERLRFTVSDTGIGIPDDKLHRLFQRFSQVDGSTSREYGGTGLGLAICKRLIGLMGGEIGVESTVGKGSIFWFAVPLSPATGVGAARAPRQGRSPVMRPCRILVVEDLDVNQEIVRSMLAASGHHVDVVSDGSEAISAVEACTYDVVLMDIQMAGMDGVTATKHIRSLGELAGQVPIVAMTANVLPQQIESFRAAGMNGHVGKPLRRDELLAAVDRAVSQRMSPALAAQPDPGHSAVVLDAEAFAAVSDLLGNQKVNELLGKLRTRLANQFPDNPETDEQWAEVAREAHKLTSSAGMLGFTALSGTCAELEAAVHDNSPDLARILAATQVACKAALSEIASRSAFPETAARSA
ncbi:PAS domain S-box-containing protein [Bradyrhizobium sp. i1.8.4]|uniref:ATP-binding protein n=1 Tax=unclassified Bradyrhizobium TaxID=2631580 RepID=UPI003D1FCA53